MEMNINNVIMALTLVVIGGGIGFPLSTHLYKERCVDYYLKIDDTRNAMACREGFYGESNPPAMPQSLISGGGNYFE